MEVFETFYNDETKIWSGPKERLLFDFNCSLGQVIFNTMKNFPNNACQISAPDGRSYTNREVLTWRIRIAQVFKKMGLEQDDVVGIVGKNTTYVMPVAIGCFLNCTPFHAVNSIYGEDTFKHIFGTTKPKVIFCDAEAYEKISAGTKELGPLIYILSGHVDGVPAVEELLRPTETEETYVPNHLVSDGDQTVAILCSSGTTGMPKCVCISQLRFMFLNGWSFTRGGVVFFNSSLDWMTGVFCFLLATVHGCTRVVNTELFSAQYFINLVEKYKVTYTFLPPRYLAELLSCSSVTAKKLSSLQFISLGGGIYSSSSLLKLKEFAPQAKLNNMYGLTEFGVLAANFDASSGSTVGKLKCGVRVRVVNDSGENLGPKEVGEIYVQDNHKWEGYYGNEVETMRTRDESGWIHTGDLGYFDEKNNLFIVDRKKDTLKYQGIHYWPGEIEEAVLDIEGVEDVCVFGIEDEKNGDAAGALVVKKEGRSDLTEEMIKEYVAKRFPEKYRQLNAGVRFAEKLPQNQNGKTIRKEAKNLFKRVCSSS